MIGTKLAHYEITGHLGTGGMGEVYQATDSKLGRSVAIKLLPDAFAQDAEHVVRFEREARVLASLNHPNIAAIYGVEESGGRKFLVMEFVGGETLAQRIARGPAPLDESLAIAKQIAEGLESAHEKGVVHRDLKPANIKVTADGRVKVLDFGLAKAFARDAGNVDLSNSPTMISVAGTNVGMILGTAAYMAPEQAKGKPVDKRADIWAFGVVLYEMLTGKPLFQCDDLTETLAAVVMRVPELDRAPVEVRRLLKKCLERDPQKRLRDIGDAWELLEPVRQTGLPAVVGNAKRQRVAYVATALATLAFAVLAAVHFREPSTELHVLRATILPPADSTFDFAGSGALPAVSPDGRSLVFGARNKDGKSVLWIRPVSSGAAQPLTGTEGGSFPFWSPDSRFIGFFAEGKLKKISTQGGPAVVLADANPGRGGSWSPEGVIVFAPSANNSPLLRVSEGGGATSPATTLDRTREESNHKFPWFLPDGRHFLYETQGGRPETIRVASIDSNGSNSNATVIVEGVGSNAAFADGRLLFMRERTLLAQTFDLERLAPVGEAVPLAEQVQTVLTSGKAGLFSASASGLLVYQSGEAAGRAQLTWFDRTGKKLRLLGDPSVIGVIEFSPDRKRLGVTLNEGVADDVWIYDVGRGIRSRFTSDAAEDRNSIWSPDGRAIVFASRRKGHVDLYRRPSDASRAEEPLYADDHDKFVTSWSPNGMFLLYTADGPKAGQAVWVLPLASDRPAGETAKREAAKPFVFGQTPFNNRDGKFSPDGRWVAYVSTEATRAEVYVAPFPGPGAKQQVSLSGGVLPRWRNDGKEIFYVGPDQRLMSAEVNEQGNTFQVGQVRPLFGPVLTRGYLYDVSADGQQFLLAVTAEGITSEPLTLVENWAAGFKNK